MKNLFLIFTAISLSFAKISAQTTLNHSSVSSLKVMYKAVAQTTANNVPNSIPEIKTIPQCTINLVPTANVTKIYFKILNAQTNAIIYQVNYPINTATLLNGEGKKLFENNNGVIFISNGQIISLKPYTYQIQTEDNQNNLSTIYSAIR